MTNSTLQLVHFIDTDGNPTPGLVPTHGAKDIDLRIDEKAAVLNAIIFKDIDYVFFRRFSDERSSQISAYVVDNSDGRLSEDTLAELHYKVWLYGTAPLLYIFWPSRIDILTCARGPDFWDWRHEECRYTPTERLESQALTDANYIEGQLDRFSALRLANGTFWDEPSNRYLTKYEETAHQMLIQAVVDADTDIQTNHNLNDEAKAVLRKLLLLIVLVKYLEDRRVFPEYFFGNFHKDAVDFFGVLRGGNPEEVDRLLNTLEQKFDGDIFSLPYKGQHVLNQETLRLFANLVEAKTIKRQRYLWKQFSFEHLPVEIISNLYQRFVKGVPGAVYTPTLLVSLLLDYAMPYQNLTGEERVLDPACGSGIFLVGAFRRLTNLWRSRNSWKRPDVDTLKHILKKSIHGIELDSSAIDLTAFSMCLAICDALQPEVIWNNLKFDKLRGSNLEEADFFSIVSKYYKDIPSIINDGFDVIIGNPPFESGLSVDGIKVNQITQRQNPKRGPLPDKQLAYLFLEQSLSILRSGGRVCLIQPSAFLYRSGVRNFRTYIHQKYKVDKIFDFTSVRKLYDAADPKTIAVLSYGSEPYNTHIINHWTFRRTTSVHERICFELDYYDQHRVSQKQAETDFYIWRANLLGGGRILEMSSRIYNMRTLSQYIKQKNWDYGEGFIAGGDKVKRTPAPFLTGKRLLPTDAFKSANLDKSKITIVKETLFRSAYTERRYSPPLILIKAAESLPIYFWDEGFIAYSSKIIGISAPKSETQELRALYDFLEVNHETYRFCCALHGTQTLTDKSTVQHKQDIDMLPYPVEKNELSFSFWEDALCKDTIDYMVEYIRLGQNSRLLKNAANPNDLQAYTDMFVRMLKSVYDNLRPADAIFLNGGLTCQPFYFGEKPDFSWIKDLKEDELWKLIYKNAMNKGLRTIRIFRFYSDNFLLLIKPDRLRYWIRSTAIRDADETIVDLRKWGY